MGQEAKPGSCRQTFADLLICDPVASSLAHSTQVEDPSKCALFFVEVCTCFGASRSDSVKVIHFCMTGMAPEKIPDWIVEEFDHSLEWPTGQL